MVAGHSPPRVSPKQRLGSCRGSLLGGPWWVMRLVAVVDVWVRAERSRRSCQVAFSRWVSELSLTWGLTLVR
jgi:hypothetical protein